MRLTTGSNFGVNDKLSANNLSHHVHGHHIGNFHWNWGKWGVWKPFSPSCLSTPRSWGWKDEERWLRWVFNFLAASYIRSKRDFLARAFTWRQRTQPALIYETGIAMANPWTAFIFILAHFLTFCPQEEGRVELLLNKWWLKPQREST